jgi:Outer membrane protein beta-barrel domain
MRATALVAFALLASPAFAEEGMYVGLGLGSFDYAEDSVYLAPERFNDTVSSWKIYGGFEINEHFAIEIRYGASDKFHQSFSGTDPNVGDFTTTFNVDFTTTSAVALGMLPKEWGVLYAGLGYFDTNADLHFRAMTELSGDFSQSGSVGDNGLLGALGVEWRFGRFGTGYGIRLEYEWVDADNASESTIGVGVSYRF